MQLFQSNFFELNDLNIELSLSEVDNVSLDRDRINDKNRSNLCGKWFIVNGSCSKSNPIISNSEYYFNIEI